MSHALHANLSRFYFIYYFFVGAFVPYWGLYLQSEQFSAADIGILMSLFQISRIFAPNFWGWLADHTKQRVVWIKLTASLGLIGFIAVFWAHGFWALFFVMAALSLFTSSTLPLSESLVLAHLATTNGHYSRIRMWGSLGFIVAAVILGFLIDAFGIQSLLWFLLSVQVVLYLLTFKLPEAVVAPHSHDQFSMWQIIKQPAVIALLVGCSLMVTAHGVLYNFYSIYLAEHGYSKTMIGFLWAIGVICEIVVFMLMPKIMGRFTLKTILLISLALAVIRFSMIGLTPDHVYLLLLAQCLHAFTFGSFHAASVEVITQFFNGRHQAKGQAIYNSVAYGVGGAVGGLAGGFALQYLGGQYTFTLAAAFPLLGFVVIMMGLKLAQPFASKGMFSE
ncbi:arabinose efflux permease family protein [Methylophilaceae bacterium 11]|uniref:MFS transporter n=1 Tax=Methylotenera sp. N17 TaxID=1502761 RepID=UPI0004486E5E|nr:MFS transporter [Methylotenera sp. N17]EUJ09866.1 arabinose efflux permease family protein [Methylophilaceae bacterium 11]